ncbi:hypothetical protein QNJ99_16780 [Bradyrhizobium elkanii]|nr:hypothetical protein [Bradyrhizobium elkanii]WLA85727.1 hypothetical protein QNJ99_16780 [Bradyrhizobium elkanii]WLA89078.1 hypothetical protein QNJ96_28890 [Bradyrhizobium elkanii]
MGGQQSLKTETDGRRRPRNAKPNKAFKTVRSKDAMTDYAKAQKAIHDNRERLKAERLAREADAANRTRAG